MRCDQFRELLSVQLDGEDQPGERGFAAAHLRICVDCRTWFAAAAALTRVARTRLASEPTPDLTDAILSAIPRTRLAHLRARLTPATLRGPRLVAAVRVLLGAIGAMQILLGVAQIANNAQATHQHGAGHLWHESAAWNVAVGAGFMWIALRRGRAVGMLPTLTAFIAVLTLLTANDMMVATVDTGRVFSHAFMVAGYLAVLLLSRKSPEVGDPPSARQTPLDHAERLRSAPTQRPSLRLLPGLPATPEARADDSTRRAA